MIMIKSKWTTKSVLQNMQNNNMALRSPISATRAALIESRACGHWFSIHPRAANVLTYCPVCYPIVRQQAIEDAHVLPPKLPKGVVMTSGRYYARVYVERKQIALGGYATLAEAEEAIRVFTYGE